MDDTENTNQPFGQILKSLIEASSFSREEFEDEMNSELEKCPSKDNVSIGGMAPPVRVVMMMLNILHPTDEERKSLFRALAPLTASDETKPFSELATTCRLAAGLTLKDVSSKMKELGVDDEYEDGIKVALYEMGILFPSADEGEVLAEIFVIPEHERMIFTNKVAATLQKGIKVVDEDFEPSTGPSEEDVEEAKQMVSEEGEEHTKFIVSEAAKILEKLKKEDEDK